MSRRGFGSRFCKVLPVGALAGFLLMVNVYRVQAAIVPLPPTIAEAFNPSSIPQFDFSTLTFTITNPTTNTSDELGVAFDDNLPTGITFSLPPCSLIRVAARPSLPREAQQ